MVDAARDLHRADPAASAIAACRDPKNHKYPPAGGLPELKQAIVEKTMKRFGAEAPRFSPRQADLLWVVGTISQRQAETSATVRDGDSFVIGGLTQDENITNKGKIPILGDIPIIGEAFKNTHNTRARTELYIIVTPHIVHRVGSQALTQARQEPYDSQPVTTVPAPSGTVNYVPIQPPANVPNGDPLGPPHR